MDKKKTIYAIIALILGGITVSVAYNITTNMGDTTINYTFDEETLKKICQSEILPEKYQDACKELGLIP